MSVLTQIPDNWNVPGSNAEVVAIRTGTMLTAMPLRILVIGQLSGGLVQPLVPVPVTDPSQPPALFGPGTRLARAVVKLLNAAPYVQIDVIGVAPVQDSLAATGSVLPVGTATGAGTFAVLVGGVRVPVTVPSGTTAAQAQAALIAALATVADAANMVTMTADGTTAAVNVALSEKGAEGNNIDLRMSSALADQVPGLTFTVTPFSGGGGAPDITDALDAVSNTWYTDIFLGLTDTSNLTEFTAELTRRYGAMVRKDAHGYIGFRGSYADTLTLLQGLNCPYLCVLPANNPKWSPWEAGAVFCGIAAQASNNDPARQMRDLVLTGLEALGPDDGDLFTEEMRNVILGQGGATFDVGQDGTVTLERAVTSYKTDANSLPDTSWQDIMTVKTATRVRYEFRTYTGSGWATYKLADDGSPLSMADGVITPSIAKAEWIAQCKIYEANGWIENVDTLGPQAVFWRDPGNRNRMLYTAPIQVIGSLIRLDGQIQVEV